MQVRLTVHKHRPLVPSEFQPLIIVHVCQINFFLRNFSRVQYTCISFYVTYFVYCMLIQMNLFFVIFKLASLLVRLTMHRHRPLVHVFSVFKPPFILYYDMSL